MYDELVKGPRFCAMTDLSEEEYPCDPCEYKAPEKYHIKNKVCYLGCFQQMMLHAADAIEELSKLNAEITRRELKLRMEKPRWIPVTERLPDAGERVLCYCRANIYEVMKMRTDGDWVSDTNHVYMHSFVTHWMPLPEPPKEE